MEETVETCCFVGKNEYPRSELKYVNGTKGTSNSTVTVTNMSMLSLHDVVLR